MRVPEWFSLLPDVEPPGAANAAGAIVAGTTVRAPTTRVPASIRRAVLIAVSFICAAGAPAGRRVAPD